MNRLTKKFNGEYYPKNANTIVFNTEIDYNVIQKLGKLEDLEEELGCSLQEVLKDKITPTDQTIKAKILKYPNESDLQWFKRSKR